VHVGTADTLSVRESAEQSPENLELRQLLDDEIGRLPERLRTPMILCYLDGKTVAQAAAQLGWPRGTVASRLARARERLRIRLAGRGITLTLGLAALSRTEASLLPLTSIPALAANSLRYSAGAASVGLSASAITMTQEVLKSMSLEKLRTGVVALVTLVSCLLIGGGLTMALRAHAEPPALDNPPEARATGQDDPARDKPPRRVNVVHPVRGEVTPFEIYTGRLQSLRYVAIRPTVSGVLEKVCFKAGADVKKGEVLFELDSRSLKLAMQKIEVNVALAHSKKQQSDAECELRRKGGATNLLTEQQLVAQANDAAAALKTAQIDLENAKLALEATRIIAPISGQVGRPLVEPGAFVFRGTDSATLLTSITSLDPIGVSFEMDERSFLGYQRSVRAHKVEGAGSRIHLQLSDGAGFVHEGTLDSFEDHIDMQSGTVSVRGSLANPDRLLLPGMFAKVRVTLGPPHRVLQVPEGTILSDQGQKCVPVVNNRNLVELRKVTLGRVENGLQAIEAGLREEDWVITSGFDHSGDLVEPVKSRVP
jgi:multidrug efflux system membrane fusion protein